MKKIISFILLSAIFSVSFAENKKARIQVLPDRTTMPMDLAVYENVVYEAQISLSSENDDDPIDVFINKYIDGKYDSTLSITCPANQFTTGEFRENASHYKHVKVFPIGKDEICVTVQSCYSDCHFNFFRVKKGKVVSKKTYYFKNAYEDTEYAFDGKDRIYFSYEGNDNFKETGWDNWIVAFDLDGNIKNHVKFYSNSSDEISGMVAFPDCLYITQSLNKYKKDKYESILKLSPDFEVLEIHPYDCSKFNSPKFVELDKSNDCLVVSYGEIDENNSRNWYKTSFDRDGKVFETYLMKDAFDAQKIDAISKFNFDGNKISVHGYFYSNDDLFGSKKYEKNFFLYDYVDFKPESGFVFDEGFDYKVDYRVAVKGKLFISGFYNFESTGIGHVAYHAVLEDKVSDLEKAPYAFEKVDYNPFADTETVSEKASYIKNMLRVEKSTFKTEKSKAKAKVVKLEWLSANPDDDDVIKTIPVLPFSER